MRVINLVIPRWFYPNNLGDSIHSYFAPKVIKHKFPDSKLVVVTYGELASLMSLNPYVDSVINTTGVRGLTPDYYRSWAFNRESKDHYCLYAQWHPMLWEYWNDNFNYFSNHPTANILTVNSLLQLGMESMLFSGIDLHTTLDSDIEREERTLGIAPMTKLSGKHTPHPGCDGIGLRFNGDKGESWKKFIETVKSLDKNIHIIEYSPKYLGLGDEHVGELPWPKLIEEVRRPTVSVMTDGGLHHAFNLANSPLVFLASQQVSKETHLMLSNSRFYPDLHASCMDRCYNNLRNLKGWKGLDTTCNKSCQTVDPYRLAEKVFKDYFDE